MRPAGLRLPEFVFTANAGEPLRPLRHAAASGGELSRAFLAVEQALREEGEGMVLVFDEVDAGIGGEAANEVGRQLAKKRTCSPGAVHYPSAGPRSLRETSFPSRKATEGGRTTTAIDVVEGEATRWSHC